MELLTNANKNGMRRSKTAVPKETKIESSYSLEQVYVLEWKI